MDDGKAVGPNYIPIEVCKCLREQDISWLIKLFNEIMGSKKMQDECKRSTLILIYENKGDIQNSASYIRINLKSHTMKP